MEQRARKIKRNQNRKGNLEFLLRKEPKNLREADSRKLLRRKQLDYTTLILMLELNLLECF